MDITATDMARYSPFNDLYVKEVNRIKADIAEFCTHMPDRSVEIVKLKHAGKKYAEIAEEVEASPSSVCRVLKEDKSKHLLMMLTLLRQTIDGPNKEQRFHMLWRIAVDNEKKSPKQAIAAITEMNKMAGVSKGEGGLTIIMQNGVLMKGALDE